MAIITLPTILLPYSQEFGIKPNTRSFKSIFTGTVQTVETPGALWVGSYQYPLMKDAHAKIFRSFIAKMRGEANRFYARDFVFDGQATAVNLTAAALSNTAELSTAVTFAEGDYIQVGNELKLVVEASTGITVTVEPPFRNTYLLQPATLNTPHFLAKLKSDSNLLTSVSPTTSSLKIDFEEAVE